MSRNSRTQPPPPLTGDVGSEAPAAADRVEPEAAPGRLAALAATSRRPRRRRRSVWPAVAVLVILLGAAAGGWWWLRSRGGGSKVVRAHYQVHRGDLPITVTESGGVKALHSEVIKSQVEGKATIISLVPEGTRITEDDVAKGRLLVELDSADLRERLTQQEITFANAKASYTAARESYQIQESEGESKIKQGELNVKFSRMDLEHYVGQQLCREALSDKVDLLKLAEQLFEAAREHRRTVEAETAAALKEVEAALAASAAEGPAPAPAAPQAPAPARQPGKPDERRLAGVSEPAAGGEGLGGEALQTRRTLDANIELTIEKFKRAADKLTWTARLERKGFVSHNELEADQLALKSSLIDLQQALSARELFLRYKFPKQAEEFLSLYKERGKELDRIKARARAALAQAEAKVKSNEATFRVQDDRLKKLKKQIEHCTIRATKPGLVIYATSGGHWRYRGEPIEEGSTVHERQEIIKLPDTTALAVDVKVHESVVDKVKVGLPARIRIDAFQHLRLAGKVLKVAILPDPSSRWLNPDLKQYETEVSIEGKHLHLKPGMSAEVEILIDTLTNVLQVPVQAVSTRSGKSVVYLVRPDGEEEREVVLGESNDTFVEVRSGLAEGDRILLEAPQTVPVDEEADEQADADDGEPGEPPGPRPKPGPGRQPPPTKPRGERPAKPRAKSAKPPAAAKRPAAAPRKPPAK